MTTSTVTARRKGDPQHYVEGKTIGGDLYDMPRGPKIPKIFPQMFRTKIVHTSGNIFIFGKSIFSIFGSKNVFNLCSHIELNTQNPNPIFKITIYYTKQTNNTQILSKSLEDVGKYRKDEKHILFYIMYKFHNLYFVIFVKFANFVVL